MSGDCDGDGKTGAAVFRPSMNTRFVRKSSSGTLIQTFAQADGLPILNVFLS